MNDQRIFQAPTSVFCFTPKHPAQKIHFLSFFLGLSLPLTLSPHEEHFAVISSIGLHNTHP